MTKGRFAEEFKQEAVRQVIERGYSVSDGARVSGSILMGRAVINRR